jgi:hypothetical protein
MRSNIAWEGSDGLRIRLRTRYKYADAAQSRANSHWGLLDTVATSRSGRIGTAPCEPCMVHSLQPHRYSQQLQRESKALKFQGDIEKFKGANSAQETQINTSLRSTRKYCLYRPARQAYPHQCLERSHRVSKLESDQGPDSGKLPS